MRKIYNKQKIINLLVLNVSQTLAFGKVEPEEEFAFVQLLKRYNTYFTNLDINSVFHEANVKVPSENRILHRTLLQRFRNTRRLS